MKNVVSITDIQAVVIAGCIDSNKSRIRRDYQALAIIQASIIVLGLVVLFIMTAIAQNGDVSSWKSVGLNIAGILTAGAGLLGLKKVFGMCRDEKQRLQNELDELNHVLRHDFDRFLG